MKLTYRQILSPGFVPLVARLTLTPMSVVAGFQLQKIAKRIDQEITEAMHLFNLIGAKYAEKDHSGRLLMQANGRHLVDASKFAEYDRELEALMDVEFDVGVGRLKAEDLANAQVAASDIPLLQWIAVPPA